MVTPRVAAASLSRLWSPGSRLSVAWIGLPARSGAADDVNVARSLDAVLIG